MPTLFIINGLRFFFYAFDHEPIHIHVEGADGNAKFLLEPEITLLENKGLKARQIKEAIKAIEENKEVIKERWAEFH
ncbi:DUF4160 domain-containing protein [Bacteroides caecimuris]|uniref:DUF4160 domain-containing protein n=1 Tax=Bacteroides caecimuris TaxID=1796613 RepID=UPI0026E5987A|nr:DUF4160 domain-containing protein [Bacteroides caecimuris]